MATGEESPAAAGKIKEFPQLFGSTANERMEGQERGYKSHWYAIKVAKVDMRYFGRCSLEAVKTDFRVIPSIFNVKEYISCHQKPTFIGEV